MYNRESINDEGTANVISSNFIIERFQIRILKKSIICIKNARNIHYLLAKQYDKFQLRFFS